MSDADNTTSGTTRSRRSWILVAKWGLFAAMLGFVGHAIFRQLTHPDAKWSERSFSVGPLVLAFVMVLVSKSLTFPPYGIMVGHFGHRPPWTRMAPIVWVSQLGKYLPGKIGAVVGMAWLLRKQKVATQIAVGSILIVDGLSVVVGMATAVPVMLMMEPLRSDLPMGWLWSAVAVAGLLVCVHPKVFGTAANFLLKKTGARPLDNMPRMRTYIAPVVALLVQYAFLGLGCWLMANSLVTVGPEAIPAMICTMIVATIAGFIALFAPAGLGIQEGLLFLLLPAMVGGKENAAMIAVLMRLTQIIADASLGGAGWMLLRRLASSAAEVAPAETPGEA